MSSGRKIHEHPAFKLAAEDQPGHTSYYQQVLHQNLHHFYEQVPANPCEVSGQEVLRGAVFMIEEAMEYSSAKTLEDKLDALVDIVVVALGRAAFHGFHRFDEAMARVVEANKLKIPGPSPHRGEWGRDLSKPEGWRPASLADLAQPHFFSILTASEDDSPGEDDVVMYSSRPRVPSKTTSKIADLMIERDRLLAVVEMQNEELSAARRECSELQQQLAGGITIEHDQFHPVLLECAELLVKKSRDYGSSLTDHSKAAYMPFGHYSYVHMLHTKMGRIRSISGVDHSEERTANFESLRDSVIDLINYGAFYAAWLKDQEDVHE